LPVVYLAETPAGALLEACVHTSANDIPPYYVMLAIETPATVSLTRLDLSTLPADWPEDVEKTREIGSAWLRAGRSALFRVPSALAPATFNVMLNPLHAHAARLRIQSAVKYPFDPRIKR
jgi:RES domain-containing protein